MSRVERAKEQIARGTNAAIESAAPKLLQQWSNREGRRCMHHSLEALARSVGLGSDPNTLRALSDWIKANNLPMPSRPKVK